MKEKNRAILNSDTNNHLVENINPPFSDVRYICQSATLITESAQKGFDIVQLSNGDIVVTEVKLVNILYKWDNIKKKFAKINQSL